MNQVFKDILLHVLPLAMASWAAWLSRLGGKLNIAIEGYMVAGAFLYANLALAGIPVLPALFLVLVVAALFGLALAWIGQRLDCDGFLLGMALNLLLPGLCAMATQLGSGSGMTLVIPNLSQDPWLQAGLGFLALGLPLVFHYWQVHSRLGLRLSILADHQGLLASLGHQPKTMVLAMDVFSPALAALAGGVLCFQISAWLPGMVAGTGWIALVMVYTAKNLPAILVFCLAYGSLDLLALRYQHLLPLAQLSGILPAGLLLMILAVARAPGLPWSGRRP